MLLLHRADRADRLVGALADVLADPLEDPFAGDIVAVPTRGVERWLSQQLARTLGATAGGADGVCANVAFPFPGKIVAEAVAAATGRDGQDPWAPERAVWPLLDVVHEHLDEPWLSSLAAHVHGAGTGDGALRLFGTVRRIADLYDRYAFHRVEMVNRWAAGADVDARGNPLGDQRWQAELWRRLRARLGTASPAEALDAACASMRADPDRLDLPPRLGLFGLTRLPVGYLQVLEAIGAGRDVHLFLLHPSPALWHAVDVALATGSAPATTGPPARRDDPTTFVATHPLLRSWGRDAREMQVLLASGVADVDEPVVRPPAPDAATTLLARLQEDIYLDRPPPGRDGTEGRLLLRPDDRSIAVHACHGAARQVEVLRDAILHLLADDETLQPRDIVVMCPDIDSFTPLIHATFGAGAVVDEDEDEDEGDLDDAAAAGRGGQAADHAPTLTVRLADRSLRQTNPVLAAVSELLSFVGGRFPASAVLDFADREPVRRRFALDDDDLERLRTWVATAGIRWGYDAEHRRPFQLQAVASNTWRAGLDRLLVGVAMSEEELELVGGVLPVDDVDSGDIDRAGRLTELVERLSAAVDELAGPHTIDVWAEILGRAADALTATTETDRWQRVQLERLLTDVVDEASRPDRDDAPSASVGAPPVDATPVAATPVTVDDVRTLLADRLRGQPTRANFRTGHLTMCTLVPMRSVPHRVVCLLGLDDGVFPRRTAADGDDLVERDPCVGDPDPRSEDRQLLLDALLAASEHLVVTYQARDERTNHVRPPSVPLGELLDVIDQTAVVTGANGSTVDPARTQVVIEHPLQPHDARNFERGRLGSLAPWSFDPIALAGARAAAGPKSTPGPFLSGRLAPVREEVIELDRLIQFVQHPVKAFLRLRLGLSLRGADDDLSDALPLELDGLARWGIGQRVLEHRLAGADEETCRAAELVRGDLPPGAFGATVLDEVMPQVDALLRTAQNAFPAGGHRTSFSVAEPWDGDRLLVGTIPLVTDHQLRNVTFSNLAPKHRLEAWVRWLALTYAHPEEPFEAITIGKSRSRARVATISRPDGDAVDRREFARVRLAELIDLYERGLREPLPLYAKTSCAYADAVKRRQDDPGAAARKEWTPDKFDGEDREPEHVLVRGGITPFPVLVQELAGPDDAWDDSWPDELTRFGGYARRLWDPLLAVEQLEVR